MRDRLIELLKHNNCPNPVQCSASCKYRHLESCYEERTADHLLANGVIVPPCKVGDTVWYLNRYHSIAMYKNAAYEAKVVRVYVEDGNKLCLSIQIKNEYGTTEYPRITEIGKTVFLTREEAEAALKDGTE